MRKNVYKKYLVFMVVFLFLGIVILPSISGNIKKTSLIFNENVFNSIKPNNKLPVLNPNSIWIQQAKIQSLDGSDYERFGFSVSLDGDYMLIGANNADSSKGSAYVFYWDGSNWVQEDKLTAPDGEAGDEFGTSVCLYGDYAIIGARGVGINIGSAYVFKRDGSNWVQERKLTASDGEDYDEFGISVAIEGDYALVGAHMDDDWKGSVYVFKRYGSNWIQEDKLTALDSLFFGCSISLVGNYALIGAMLDDGLKGSAYVFKRDGSTWIQEDKLVALDGESEDFFGLTVSLDGDYALIGAVGDDEYTGSAYVFKRDGSNWVQEDKLTALDGGTSDYFGFSVSLDGDYALIGACAGKSGNGSAYVFKRDGSSWVQEDKLIGLDTGYEDYFGHSVSLDGDYAVIGAYGDDDDRGSAYVFRGLYANLECDGEIHCTNVKPGDTIERSFTVENVGDDGSKLDWEITDWPDWGNWNFMPVSGKSLKPEDGKFTVNIEFVAPNEGNKEFTGNITVVNKWDTSDTDIVPVYLKTPRNKAFKVDFNHFSWLFERFPKLFLKLIRLF